METILVTGVAGFIGYHLARRLAEEGYTVVGLDNLNAYYDISLKHGRLRELGITSLDQHESRSRLFSSLRFVQGDLADRDCMMNLIERERPDIVINLAAQAGVRYSIDHPHSYQSSNLDGFLNLLEAVRAHPVAHLIYASSSSVYGATSDSPFHESASADRPVSLYAATKRANEIMAHSYAHLYGIPTTGLRFFTVYGPWGRPDMAYYLFTKAILNAQPIDVFNDGKMERDFTFIDDIVESISRLVSKPPMPDDGAPARILNIGNGAPVPLMEFIEAIELELGMPATKRMKPMQPGDVPVTWADCSALEAITGYRPRTAVRDGIREFIAWYRAFHGV